MDALAADRDEIGRFYTALFRHADTGGYVSLRTFEHDDGKPPVEIRAVQINGEGLGPVIGAGDGSGQPRRALPSAGRAGAAALHVHQRPPRC